MNSESRPSLVLSPPLLSVEAPLRRYGHGSPRFLADQSRQLDPIRGCPAAQVPLDHLAHRVLKMVDSLDVSELEQAYSSLGRRGVHPRAKLAVWIYASLTGVHEASKLEIQLKTDAALLFLSGGHFISATGLRTFRRENAAFFAKAIQQTVHIAVAQRLLDPRDLAVDSVRLRAEASPAQMRTAARAEQRLAELEAQDLKKIDPAALEKHQKQVTKHRETLAHCRAEGRTNYSTTNELAGLLKFPNGASMPGHRVTAVSAGVQLRLVVSLLLSADSSDNSLLKPSVLAAKDALRAAGITDDLQIAGDAGFISQESLQFAIEQRPEVDLLLKDKPRGRLRKARRAGGFFGQDEFIFQEDGRVICPAGRPMRGPINKGPDRRWFGVGCESCPLHAQCTPAKVRGIAKNKNIERVHQALAERMAQPGADERYARRMANVEPVFSYLQDAMGYRRVSSRHAETVRAEILLKILAYNLARLLFCPSLRVVQIEAVWDGSSFQVQELNA